MELWLGPPGPGRERVFADAVAARAAWFKHRDHLRVPNSAGRRAWAWWCFEGHGLAYPGYDRERSTLWAAGLLLDDNERGALEAEWRAAFDLAQRLPAGERNAVFAWADIPKELVRRWSSPRRKPADAFEDAPIGVAPNYPEDAQARPAGGKETPPSE
jgi:hypothetical protein